MKDSVRTISMQLMRAAGLAILLVLAVSMLSSDIYVSPVAAQDPEDSTAVPPGDPVTPDYVDGDGPAIEGHAPVIRVYQDTIPWFGENRDQTTLLSIGKIIGHDYFIHPVAACQSGIPAGTSVVFFSSNGAGSTLTTARQNNAACQASLDTFLNTGGVVIVDMGDNDFGGGYRVSGATGTPLYVFPSPCADATLAPGALGPDLILGTADDHPIVQGSDGIPGTGDDLNNSNIDMAFSYYVAHGNLVDGITLPPGATVLMTATFGGVQKPILAEYCHNGVGRIIVDTITKEFNAHHGPLGTGSGKT